MIRSLQQGDVARKAAEVLKLLAHPHRLQILALLRTRERTVTELVEILDSRPSLVSQQLRILRLRDMVEATRQGAYCRYRIVRDDIQNLVDNLERSALVRGGGGSAGRRREDR